MLKRVASWLVILNGILLAVFVIAALEGSDYWTYGFGRVVAIFTSEFVPLFASLIAMRRPRLAARIFLWASPLASLPFMSFPWQFGAAKGGAIVFFAGVLLPGLFWLFTARRGWPVALPDSFLAGRPRLIAIAGAGLFCCLIVIGLIASWFVFWLPEIGDCDGMPLLNDNGAPYGIDFTAKLLLVGPASYEGQSLWSIARVEQRFTQVPAWPGNVIILRGFFKPSDPRQHYFVEGRRSGGLLSRFLPIIKPMSCGHTAHLQNAAVAVRILRDGPPRNGVRIIGEVLMQRGYDGQPWVRRPVPGAQVLLHGPDGSTVLTTNADGIYDATGLPPGRYSVELANHHDSGGYTFDLKTGDVRKATFLIEHE